VRRAPARLVPRRPVPAGLARPVRAHQAVRAPGRPRLARPGREGQEGREAPVAPAHPVLGHPAPAPRARVLRVPARGRVTTRSARPRPAWARRPRPGLRVPFPASRVVPARQTAVPAAPANPAAPAARVPAAEARLAQAGAARMADRALAGSGVRVPAAPGRAR
jgi:hypothetical protein